MQTMRLLMWLVAAFIAQLGTAAADEIFALGYLELEGDPRYRESHLEARYPGQPWGRPYMGAEVAAREARFASRAAGVALQLVRKSGPNLEQLLEIQQQLRSQGVRFYLLDLPGDLIAEFAARTKEQDIVLFNLSALDSSLRQDQCHKHLFHIAPSRVMLTDALAQFLVSKKWRRVLALKGPGAEDESFYEAFVRSAKRFGLKIVDSRAFVLGRDPRQRGQNNVALLTAGGDYDVVFVADANGEFAREVPYNVQRPRPVVGGSGLVADWWLWAWERYGAPQLNRRFTKQAGRLMTGYDWSSWMGVKVIAEALLRTGSSSFQDLTDHIRGEELVVDGFKGYRLNFRPWNNQLRQPLFVTTLNWVVAQVPLEGFLHPTHNLDTLGFDERENRCRF